MAVGIIAASIASGVLGYKASSDASKASSGASAAATAETARQFDLVRDDTRLSRGTGDVALTELASELGLSVPDYSASDANIQKRNDIQAQIYKVQNELTAARSEDNYIGWRGGANSGAVYGPADADTLEEITNRLTKLQKQYAELPTEVPRKAGKERVLEGEVLPEFESSAGPLPEYGDAPRLQRLSPYAEYEGQEDFQGGRFEFDPSTIEQNPNYQFILSQALKGVNRGMGGAGKRLSGNRMAELTRVAGGVAAGELDKEFERQYATSGENYGRGANEYNLRRSNALDVSDRGRTRALDLFNAGQQVDTAQHAIDRDVFDVNYRRNQDQYGREVGRYAIDTSRADELYKRRQDRLDRLAGMAGLGQGASRTSAAAGSNAANATGNILMSNAGNQAAAAAGKYSAINNAVQGYLDNATTQNQQDRLTNLYNKPVMA